MNQATDNQNTEQKIIEAAKQVFMEKGLEATKMSDIADRAGISRTALNYYYRTKEKLFYAIIEEVFNILLPKIEYMTILNGDTTSKIDAIVEIYDDLLRNHQFMPRFAFIEIQRNPQLIHDFVANNPIAQTYLNALDLLINPEVKNEKNPTIPKAHLISVFFGLLFVPYLIDPLLAMYRSTNEDEKTEFLDEHKKIVKKLLNAYFE